MPIPTPPADIERINAMFNGMLDDVGYLAFRWLDEREYEDIKDYQRHIEEKLIARGFDFVKVEAMLTRPFGFMFSIGSDSRFVFTVKSTGTAQWKRVA